MLSFHTPFLNLLLSLETRRNGLETAGTNYCIPKAGTKYLPFKIYCTLPFISTRTYYSVRTLWNSAQLLDLGDLHYTYSERVGWYVCLCGGVYLCVILSPGFTKDLFQTVHISVLSVTYPAVWLIKQLIIPMLHVNRINTLSFQRIPKFPLWPFSLLL